MDVIQWVLTIVGIFLVADAVLAILFGTPYMLWGLEHTPDWYRYCITRLSALPQHQILAIKIAECSAGLILFWLAQRGI